jgi:hypothetical protein
MEAEMSELLPISLDRLIETAKDMYPMDTNQYYLDHQITPADRRRIMNELEAHFPLPLQILLGVGNDFRTIVITLHDPYIPHGG